MTIPKAIVDNIIAHQGYYVTALTGLIVAGVCTMPPDPPLSFKDLWHWVRDALQTAIPAARHKEPVLPQQSDEAEPKQ